MATAPVTLTATDTERSLSRTLIFADPAATPVIVIVPVAYAAVAIDAWSVVTRTVPLAPVTVTFAVAPTERDTELAETASSAASAGGRYINVPQSAASANPRIRRITVSWS